ncbi:5-oxoprolinase/urea amidolyase family protein [bacterium]|nr:MAG: 5-oxoprolinase/urea amidolyase family protein [bacterium]
MSSPHDRSLEILEAGIHSTVQDFPGRRGYQARGFFPAGPMDAFALRAANLLVANDEGAAGIEITLGKFAVRFTCETTAALTGAAVDATLNGEPLSLWGTVHVAAGDELRIGMAKGPGFRVYLAVAGGIDVPLVLGSRATYTMGALGGLDGRLLKKGDHLSLLPSTTAPRRYRFEADAVPHYSREWEIEVMRGPQADPDFLTPEDLSTFFASPWSVGHNSNRVGVRLGTTHFTWARKTGGVAGGHPSNILDNGYPLGGINLNGDTPVILGPDGPTAGGFVVIATVVGGALWKLGQLRPGSDAIRFKEVDYAAAASLTRDLEARLSGEHLVEI